MKCSALSSRRAFGACLTTATLLAVALSGEALAQSSSKRGVAGGGYDLANAANASWYYHWSNDPAATPEHAPILSGAMHGQYTPMIWGGNLGNLQGKINRILGYKDTLGVEYVLGFNEPERTDQANLSVASAIAMWTQMDAQLAQSAGLKLVSPAVSDNAAGQAWLADFMTQANASNLQVDAVAFHWYGSVNINNPTASANGFLSRVDSYWNTYGLPVWITEFAGMDWGDQYTSQQIIDFNKAFLDVVIPGLESRSYVDRYSWWQFGLRNQNPDWEIDSQLFEQVNGVWTPTTLGDSYVETLMEGDSKFLNVQSTGMDTIYMRGGLISNGDTTDPSVIYAIDAIEGNSDIGAGTGAQTIVSGGTVRVRNGAVLNKIYAGTVIFEDVQIINEGEIHVRNAMQLAGALTFGGDGSGDFIVDSNGVLLISGDISGMHNDLVITGGGIVNFEPSEAGAMTGGIEVQAGGSLRIGSLAQDGNVFPDAPTSFVNNGTVQVYDAERISNMAGSGSFFAEEELVEVISNGAFAGEIGIRDGATLRPLNALGLGSIAGKTVVYGDQQKGILELTGGVSIGAEPLELKGRQGAAINAPHIVNAAGNNTWAGPISLTVSGTQWTIRSDAGLLTLSGGIVSSPDNLSRTLKLEGDGDGQFNAAITMNPSAINTLNKSGNGTWSINASATGFNTVQINAGTLTLNAAFSAAQINVNSGGTLSGSNTISAPTTVKDGGTLDPGNSNHALFVFTQGLTLQTGATLRFDATSPLIPGFLYDVLIVTGALSLEPGVTLELALDPGYNPVAGDSFDLLNWGSVSGSIDQFSLPALDAGLAWDTSSVMVDGSLAVVLALAGDTDGDGDIDDSDLGNAFANYTGPVGASGGKSAAQGDTDGDGDIDDSDLGTAFSGYTGPLSPTNVPEPASLSLLAIGGLLAARRRR